MRKDAIGLFWQDLPEVKKEKKVKEKKEPPFKFWEQPGYLPKYEAVQHEFFSDLELLHAAQCNERLVYDVEVYPNYFIVSFKSLISKKIVYFELSDSHSFDPEKLKWVLDNFCCIGFNSIKYDAIILDLILNGATTSQLWWATEQLITFDVRPYELLKQCNIEPLRFNHIDLIEVAPLFASLKLYGGRMHVPRMQDLPFKPGMFLTSEQMIACRLYNFNDLQQTEFLYVELTPQIELREKLSVDYNQDLRSKSDAQIAEAVLNAEIAKLNGMRCTRPTIAPGTKYKYKVPGSIVYTTPLMQRVLQLVKDSDFVVGKDGSIEMPEQLRKLSIGIGSSVYTMGIGGLHSTEKGKTYIAANGYLLRDRDVTSYYPQIILNQALYPTHLGRAFLIAFSALVKMRLHAKESATALEKQYGSVEKMPDGIKQAYKTFVSTAESLKIVINGTFGKLANKWSVVYSPDLMVQVTVSGQLFILMLIERLELAGITVISANTDGIVSKFEPHQEELFNSIVAQWEKDTGLKTEETAYSGLYSRDVNNYIAITTKGKVKTKGAYGLGEKSRLAKNPTGTICSEAIIAFLKDKVPIEKTIRECKNIEEFVHVRHATGGALKDGEYLGKTLRWYYKKDQEGEIIYAKNGNKIPKSYGAKPLMTLPNGLPEDIDYDWYEREANEMLADLGY
jgi:hypothetical protein